MINIYIYETRNLNYLKYYTNCLQIMGLNPIVIRYNILHNNKDFINFYNLYEHNSDNSMYFEMQCFARYFAIQKLHTSNDQFIISDSDIFVTSYIKTLQDKLISRKNVFIGSEGYDENGSEEQISPHFSVWNKELLNDFIDHLFYSYSKNKKDNHLREEYIYRKKRFFRTGISDMTLLKSWVINNSIPFYNSNKLDELGIDHNISSLISQNETFISFCGRKRIFINEDDFRIKDIFGNFEKMSVLHLQGRYKISLLDFYKKHKFYFLAKSFYIKSGRLLKPLLLK